MLKLFLGLFFCGLITLSGCQSTPDPIHITPPQVDQKNVVLVPVTKVIDGDTIKVSIQGKEETIRFLLIDTPETHHPKLGVQPYGPEASKETHRLLENKRVTLEFAQNQARDKYGRLLAYLFINGKSVEIDLLEKGLARVAYVIPPNTKYLDAYRMAEGQAKKAHLGVWKTPGYAQKDGFHPEVMSHAQPTHNTLGFAPDSMGECRNEIKGNVSNRGKIYHLPNDPFYKKTKAERCFSTQKEAVKAGFRAVK